MQLLLEAVLALVPAPKSSLEQAASSDPHSLTRVSERSIVCNELGCAWSLQPHASQDLIVRALDRIRTQ